MRLRDHTFLGMTQSLCPECLCVLPAKIISRNDRVYFRKHCPDHGVREDFVCSDVRWFDRMEHSTPGKLPPVHGVEPVNGCPLDCGLCTEHEQHTCIALLEVTSSCNLTCPMCFAGSAPGGHHLTLEECRRAIDRLVQVEGQPEVLQLSGGEPTIHPEFVEVLRYACDQPIDVVMINANGIRFARDAEFLEQVASLKHRVEIYFQFDGLDESNYVELRGESLLDTKLAAIEALGEAGLNVTLVSTLQANVNDDQIGDLIRFAMARKFVTGVSFQPATYSGRYFLPADLEDRITFPDVVKSIAEQAGEFFAADDFLPLPCAHPNGHTLAYAFRSNEEATPINRFVDLEKNMDLLANGIVFTRDRAQQLIGENLSRACDSGCDAALHLPRGLGGSIETGEDGDAKVARLANAFLGLATTGELQQSDLLRVTITSFMDAYNFDVRQLMKSCVHHVLPSGHIIPFSAYNVLYRDGHVPLPDLSDVLNGTSPGPSRQSKSPLVQVEDGGDRG